MMQEHTTACPLCYALEAHIPPFDNYNSYSFTAKYLLCLSSIPSTQNIMILYYLFLFADRTEAPRNFGAFQDFALIYNSTSN